MRATVSRDAGPPRRRERSLTWGGGRGGKGCRWSERDNVRRRVLHFALAAKRRRLCHAHVALFHVTSCHAKFVYNTSPHDLTRLKCKSQTPFFPSIDHLFFPPA